MPKDLSNDTGTSKELAKQHSSPGDSSKLDAFHREDARNIEAHKLQNRVQRLIKLDKKEIVDQIINAFAEKHERRLQQFAARDNVSVQTPILLLNSKSGERRQENGRFPLSSGEYGLSHMLRRKR